MLMCVNAYTRVNKGVNKVLNEKGRNIQCSDELQEDDWKRYTDILAAYTWVNIGIASNRLLYVEENTVKGKPFESLKGRHSHLAGSGESCNTPAHFLYTFITSGLWVCQKQVNVGSWNWLYNENDRSFNFIEGHMAERNLNFRAISRWWVSEDVIWVEDENKSRSLNKNWLHNYNLL